MSKRNTFKYKNNNEKKQRSYFYMFHFIIARCFGPIPIEEKVYTPDEDYTKIERQPIDDVYKFIANECDRAAALLEPVIPESEHDWGMNTPFNGFPVDSFSVQWSGIYRPQKSGIVEFVMTGDDGYCLFLDEKLIIWDWRDKGLSTKTVSMFVEAGKEYKIRAIYYDNAGAASVKLTGKFVSENTLKSKLNKAQSVVICVGFDSDTEIENADRTFALSAYQQQYIDFVARYNSHDYEPEQIAGEFRLLRTRSVGKLF